MAKVIKFEDKMNRLNEIVELLKDENTDIDKSINLYKEGLELSKQLQNELNSFKDQIEEIGKEQIDG